MKIEAYSKCSLTDKVYEKLDRRTFIERRNELDRQKLEELRREESKTADDEQ